MKRMPALILCLTCLTAQAQTVWRCGADGRTYTATPCADGVSVDVSDRRTATEREAARSVHLREKASVRQLAAERHQRDQEAKARGLGPSGIPHLAAASNHDARTSAATKAAPKSERKGKSDSKQRVKRTHSS